MSQPSIEFLKDDPCPPFQLGPWTVDPQSGTIRNGLRKVQLEPKIMAILVTLARHSGRTTARETLMQSVWPETYVEENALNRAVSMLRKALEDDVRKPRYLRTVPKKGYQLLVPARPVDAASVPHGSLQEAAEMVLLPKAPAEPRAVPFYLKKWAVGLAALVLLGVLGWMFKQRPQPALAMAPQRHGGQNMVPKAAVPITFQPGMEYPFALAPVGNGLAYINQRMGEQPRLYYGQWDQGNHQVLYKAPGFSKPRFSPDATRLAVVVESERTALAIFDLPQAEHRFYAAPEGYQINGVDWLKPGDRMVAMVTRNQVASLFAIDLQSGQWQAMPQFQDVLGQGKTLEISPDGHFVAYTAGHYWVEELYLLDLRGGPPRQLTSDHRHIPGMTWRDNHNLVFASNRGGNYALWQLDIAGGEPIPFAEVTPFDPSSPVFFPDGALGYVEWYYDYNIWILDLPQIGGSFKHRGMIATQSWEKFASLSPDGTQLSFSSTRDGLFGLYLCNETGIKVRELHTTDRGLYGPPDWSPDGKRLVFSASEKGRAGDLYQYLLEEERVERLTRHPASDAMPSYLQDGRSVIFSSSRRGYRQLMHLNLDDGSIQSTEIRNGWRARPAPDRPVIYFTYTGQVGLYEAPLTAQGLPMGPPRLILPNLGIAAWGHWQPVDGGVLYLLQGPEVPELWRWSHSEGTTQKVCDMPTRIPANLISFSVDRAGTKMYLTRVDQRESEIVRVPLKAAENAL